MGSTITKHLLQDDRMRPIKKTVHTSNPIIYKNKVKIQT